MAKKSTYPGFPKATLKFLRELRKDNTKTWFDAHRDQYDQYYVQAARDFVSAIEPKLKKMIPELVIEPRINGSIFRINRDIRFSKDKRPYKDHLDMTFWQGEKKTSSSHLFFRISPTRLYIGTGYHPNPKNLKQFRTAVANPQMGKELASIAKKLRKSGFELKGAHYKRSPRGFTDDGPAAEFLLHNCLHVVTEDKAGSACTPNIVKQCLDHWKATLPLHCWLTTFVRN